MISRRSALVIAAGFSALALASCGQKSDTPAAKDTISFSILSTESPRTWKATGSRSWPTWRSRPASR